MRRQRAETPEEAAEYLRSQGCDVEVFPGGEARIDGGWILGGASELPDVAKTLRLAGGMRPRTEEREG